MSWTVSAFSYVWTSTAKMKVSQHTCVFDSRWTFQPVPFRAHLSWPHSPPPPPLSLSLSLSLSLIERTFPFLTKRLTKRWTFSCIDTQRTMTRWLSGWLFVQLQFELHECYKQLAARDHLSLILLLLFSISTYSSSFSKPKIKTDIKLQSKERI